MELRKFTDFKLSEVTKLNSDKLIVVDECHYIGAFFSTTQITPISLDGLRYNLIHGLDLDSDTVNAEMYRLPTGVVYEKAGTSQPKSFKFRDMVIYENRDMESEIEIYRGTELVGKVVELDYTDRLVVLTDEAIDPDEYHAHSRYPHRRDKNLLVQSHIQEFNTMLPKDVLGVELPEFEGVPSAFNILPAFKKVIVDAYLDTSRCNHSQGVYQFSWEPIYRIYDQPYLPALSNKFI